MITLQNSTRLIGNISATDDDGSLQELVYEIKLLLGELLLWVKLQLSIAGVASDLIIETRLVMQRVYAALGLAIEIMVAVLRVIHWLEDLWALPGQTLEEIEERWTHYWFEWSWNYGH